MPAALIMDGQLRRRIPLLARRLIALVPALAVVALGTDPSRALMLSQVVLSFGIPFAVDSAGAIDQRPGTDGRRGQPSGHHSSGLGDRSDYHRFESGPDLPDRAAVR